MCLIISAVILYLGVGSLFVFVCHDLITELSVNTSLVVDMAIESNKRNKFMLSFDILFRPLVIALLHAAGWQMRLLGLVLVFS